MPVEYNWVPDYEDPARMKREGRRGEVFTVVTVTTHGYFLVYILLFTYNVQMYYGKEWPILGVHFCMFIGIISCDFTYIFY